MLDNSELKRQLRKKYLNQRNFMNSLEKKRYDERLLQKLFADDHFKNASTVSCFVNFGSELNTIPIFKEAWYENKRLFVPRVISKKEGMEMVEIEAEDELAPGQYGLSEPARFLTGEKRPDLDLIIVPGLVFDKLGYRIGYGGGFYDRFLANYIETPKLALAYPSQIVEELPRDSFDIAVDKVLVA